MITLKYIHHCSLNKDVQTISFKTQEEADAWAQSHHVMIVEQESTGAAALSRVFG